MPIFCSHRLPETAVTFFENSCRQVFSSEQLRILLSDYQEKMRGMRHLTKDLFLRGLLDQTDLKEITIRPVGKKLDGGSYTPFLRYVRGSANAFQVALSLRPRSYLSHASALQIHGVASSSDDIYVNKEQSPKPTRGDSGLTQESIDNAFSAAPRVSNYVFKYQKTRIHLLNGKHTGDYGVIEIANNSGIRCTSVERTLLDIAVRPAYAGGVRQVLKAYRELAAGIDINELVAAINHISHAYPYQQAVGFYLSHAGIDSDALALLRRIRTKFKFYLAHQMETFSCDEEWNVFYPKGLLKAQD